MPEQVAGLHCLRVLGGVSCAPLHMLPAWTEPPGIRKHALTCGTCQTIPKTEANPMNQNQLDQLCINTIRALSMDGVQKANSGHPGMPMGAADMAYVLWTRFLKHNPTNPIGSIVIALCCLPGTVPCCCTACFI